MLALRQLLTTGALRLPSSWAVATAFGALVLVGCASSEATSTEETIAQAESTSVPEVPTSVVVSEPSSTSQTSSEPSTSQTSQAPQSSAPEVEPEDPGTTAPETPHSIDSFNAEIFEISGPIASRMTNSWREGCPVELSDLRLIALNYWDYDGRVANGELVVHESHADDIVQVFSRLFDSQFPIERMELVDNFEGSDDLSMVANNTSAFNCRNVAGTDRWSDHAFGAAVDINPLVNPWVTNNGVFPSEGADFADRSVQVQGGIYPGDVVTQAFAEIGWEWGGDWNNSKDWQHFSG